MVVALLAIGLLAAGAGAGCSGGSGSNDGGAGGSTGSGGSGGPSGTLTASCTGSIGVGLPGLAVCEEVTGLTSAEVTQFQMTCAASADGGATVTFAQGPCSRANALGGCRTTEQGHTVTIWYSATTGITQAQIQQLCAQAGLTFVAP
jgi:hypothetical protein